MSSQHTLSEIRNLLEKINILIKEEEKENKKDNLYLSSLFCSRLRKKAYYKEDMVMSHTHYSILQAMVILDMSYWTLSRALYNRRIKGVKGKGSRSKWWIPKEEVERIKRML